MLLEKICSLTRDWLNGLSNQFAQCSTFHLELRNLDSQLSTQKRTSERKSLNPQCVQDTFYLPYMRSSLNLSEPQPCSQRPGNMEEEIIQVHKIALICSRRPRRSCPSSPSCSVVGLLLWPQTSLPLNGSCHLHIKIVNSFP